MGVNNVFLPIGTNVLGTCVREQSYRGTMWLPELDYLDRLRFTLFRLLICLPFLRLCLHVGDRLNFGRAKCRKVGMSRIQHRDAVSLGLDREEAVLFGRLEEGRQ